MTFYISPYRRLSSLRQAMDRMFEETLAETPQPEREMALAIDVLADDEGYTLYALVPGLTADEVEIEILNNTVTLRGALKSSVQESAKYLLCELPSGNFSRVITLPTAVDANKAEATIKNGILSLYIPKAEAHRPKAIKVKSES
jgi:HSP20 family protein